MAGLGFKDFQVGEVLTSSDVDGYLMQQTVMRFADSGARGSALGTAAGTSVALAEGMVTYLDDVNDVQFYNGASWSSVIGIKQVLQTTKTDTFSTTSTSFTPLTGLTASITPSTASSKILVIASLSWGIHAISSSPFPGAMWRLTGGNADDYIGDAASSRIRSVAMRREVGTVDGANFNTWLETAVYLDSPATTSSVTYGVECRTNNGTFYLNRTHTDSDSTQYARTASSITVVEVAA